MKFTGYTINSFLQRPDPSLRAFLVFGVDNGLVVETFNKVSALIVPDLNDAFNVVNLTCDDIKGNPSVLSDEASAYSLMGGRKVIRVTEADDSVTESLKLFLENYTGQNFVVLAAGDLSKTSKLRKLAEASDFMGSFACYADNLQTLKSIILEESKKAGKTLEPQAISYLADNLGADRAIARSELAKLFVYAYDEQQISEDMVRQVIGDGSAVNVGDVAYAAGDGNFKALDKAIKKVFAEDETAAISIVRTTIGHFRNLHIAKVRFNEGMRMDEAIKFYPPIHFSRVDDFKRQVMNWSVKDLERVLRYLIDLEIQCKSTGSVPETVAEAGLTNICRLAIKSKR